MTNKIMVVEDNFAHSKIIVDWIERAGWMAITAFSVNEAKEKLNREFAVITLDLRIPIREVPSRLTKKDNASIDDFAPKPEHGLQLAEFIKTDLRFKNIPVIPISVIGDESYLGKLNSLGITEYIRKPLSENILVEKIKSILG